MRSVCYPLNRLLPNQAARCHWGISIYESSLDTKTLTKQEERPALPFVPVLKKKESIYTITSFWISHQKHLHIWFSLIKMALFLSSCTACYSTSCYFEGPKWASAEQIHIALRKNSNAWMNIAQNLKLNFPDGMNLMDILPSVKFDT